MCCYRYKVENTMREDIIVSVVIPIYNVSKWIDRGLEVILSQSLKDIEVLLVDDGSTDDSAEKCRAWIEKDDRVRLISKENGGAGSARNAGLDVSKGRYVYFFDIDDIARPNLLEYCSSKMDELQVDYMMFGFNMIEKGYVDSTIVCTHDEQIINNNSELKDAFIDQMLLCTGGNGFPWNKMYRLEFLNKHKLRFENQRIQQDEVFNILVYRQLEKAYISSEILYDYFIYSVGNTRSRFIPERFDIYVSVREHFEDLFEYWHLKDNRVTQYLNRRFFDGVNQTLRFNMFHSKCDWDDERRKEELDRVMSHTFTLNAIDHVTMNFEESLFVGAYKAKSIMRIRFFNWLFDTLRKARHLFKK